MEPLPRLSGHSDEPVLSAVVDIIAKSVTPYSVYLLGKSFGPMQGDTIFMANPATAPTRQCPTVFYLLVLLSPAEERSCEAVQDIVERRCRSVVPVTALVMNRTIFTEWIVAGHPFANHVVREARLLFSRKKASLPLPATEITGPYESIYLGWLKRAKAMLEGAEVYMLKRETNLTVFLLHQATEHTLLPLILRMTGLRAVTHNLDKLVRYTRLFTYEVDTIFSRYTEKDDHLFKILQKSYVHSRYSLDFAVEYPDALVLMNKVNRLQEYAASLAGQPNSVVMRLSETGG